MDDLSKYNYEGSDLRKAQLKMLSILLKVVEICDNHNIHYWLSFGTLLGAVRHKGFIPWDDDLDIEVEYRDYKKLLKFLEAELPGNMVLQYEKKEKKYFHNYAKVRDRNSIVHEDQSIDFKERGIFIDIFPREYSITGLKNISLKILGSSLLYLKLNEFKDKRRMIIQRVFYKLRILIFTCLTIFTRAISLILPLKKMFIPSLNIGIDKKHIFPLNEISFEGYKFKCPRNTDAFLKANYGDYMKIPSAENRITHSTKIEFLNV